MRPTAHGRLLRQIGPMRSFEPLRTLIGEPLTTPSMATRIECD